MVGSAGEQTRSAGCPQTHGTTVFWDTTSCGNAAPLSHATLTHRADIISLEEVDELMRQPYSVCVSCYMNLGLEYLLDSVWEAMGMVRVYTKKTG
jgi:hypothetical protein